MHREAYCDGAGVTAEWAEGTAGQGSRAELAVPGGELVLPQAQGHRPHPVVLRVRPLQTLGSLPLAGLHPESGVGSFFPTSTLGPKVRGHISDSSQTHIWDSAAARPRDGPPASPSREDRPPAAPEPLRWSWRQEPQVSGHRAGPGWGQGPEGQRAQAWQSAKCLFLGKAAPALSTASRGGRSPGQGRTGRRRQSHTCPGGVRCLLRSLPHPRETDTGHRRHRAGAAEGTDESTRRSRATGVTAEPGSRGRRGRAGRSAPG